MKAPSSQKSPKKLHVEQLCTAYKMRIGPISFIHGTKSSRWEQPLGFLMSSWGEERKEANVCFKPMLLEKKKKQENWFSNPGNLRLNESMSISLDSPCPTVCLHLPFLSLTTKLGSCLTRAALGCTCPFITFLWKKKKKASLTSYLKQHTKTVPKKREWNDFISHDGFKTSSKFSSFFFWS